MQVFSNGICRREAGRQASALFLLSAASLLLSSLGGSEAAIPDHVICKSKCGTREGGIGSPYGTPGISLNLNYITASTLLPTGLPQWTLNNQPDTSNSPSVQSTLYGDSSGTLVQGLTNFLLKTGLAQQKTASGEVVKQEASAESAEVMAARLDFLANLPRSNDPSSVRQGLPGGNISACVANDLCWDCCSNDGGATCYAPCTYIDEHTGELFDISELCRVGYYGVCLPHFCCRSFESDVTSGSSL